MKARILLILATVFIGLSAATSQAQFFLNLPNVVVVNEPGPPKYYDPYYNQNKYWGPAPPPRYYKSTDTKKHGNKVTKTTKIRNQYGQVVYENKQTTQKKKKK
ncbi:hypothetical protein BH09VER1_BH09VER1_20920 [soil metagenome]